VTTTRIHDLAAEFGISSEQLIGLLKELDIFVRSHLSPLKPEQVPLRRARWEREKRKLKEAPAPLPVDGQGMPLHRGVATPETPDAA